MLSTLAFANTTYSVNTGYGYLTDSSGHVVARAQYPLGKVSISDGYAYVEVADETTMKAVKIYQAPVSSQDAFRVDVFVQQLALTNLMTDPNVFPYYAVIKDLCSFKNFQGLANMVAGLLQSGKLNQEEVDTLSSVLENQQINMDSYNSEVNAAY